MPWTYRFPMELREVGDHGLRLEVIVQRASLEGFVSALGGLKEGRASHVVLRVPGGALTVELRHDRNLQFVPPVPLSSRKGISTGAWHGAIYRLTLNDLDIGNLWHYYRYWAEEGVPSHPGAEFQGWHGEKHLYGYFTHDARRDRTGPAPVRRS